MDVKGVREAQVSLEEGTAKVFCDQNVRPEQLVQAVEEAGFEAEIAGEPST